MLGEGPTLEQVRAAIAMYDVDPTLGNHVNEPTRGDWMMLEKALVQDSLLEQAQQATVVEHIMQTGVLEIPTASEGEFPPREA